MKYKILSVCGTGIATSTVAAETLKEKLKLKGLDVVVKECKAAEVKSNVEMFKPALIINTTPVSNEAASGIKKFSGLPFLTGVGVDQLVNSIIDYLNSLKE
jgi:PTS system galactitol-specific IIB component